MSASPTTTTHNNNNNNNNNTTATTPTTTTTTKPRILCLHGKHQSGAIFANKISGARRKLERQYDLTFLDGPVRLNHSGSDDLFAWWEKDDRTGRHVGVAEGLDYVVQHMRQQQYRPYDALLGFSQGGVVATAVACRGHVPGLKAIVTAGSPLIEEAFRVLDERDKPHPSTSTNTSDDDVDGYQIPKLHFAGQTDAIISVDSTTALSNRGGHGQVVVHDQGHLFPTRAARVQTLLEFLDTHLSVSLSDDSPS